MADMTITDKAAKVTCRSCNGTKLRQPRHMGEPCIVCNGLGEVSAPTLATKPQPNTQPHGGPDRGEGVEPTCGVCMGGPASALCGVHADELREQANRAIGVASMCRQSAQEMADMVEELRTVTDAWIQYVLSISDHPPTDGDRELFASAAKATRNMMISILKQHVTKP